MVGTAIFMEQANFHSAGNHSAGDSRARIICSVLTDKSATDSTENNEEEDK